MKIYILIALCVFPFFLNAQVITTVAGNGGATYNGDSTNVLNIGIGTVGGICFDNLGNYYLVNRVQNQILKVDAITGIIHSITGIGSPGFSGDGNLAINAKLNNPVWVTSDRQNNLYIADLGNNRIRKISNSGIISTIAGNGNNNFSGDGGLATGAELSNPVSVCVDDSGNIYELETTRIRKISTSGIINTIVGDGLANYSGDGGLAVNAEIHAQEIYIDFHQNLYITDLFNYRIRKVNLINGIINTIAGSGNPGYVGDGANATLCNIEPFAMLQDLEGNLLISDGNQRIRKIDINGIITTIAGIGVIGYSGDGGQANLAKFHNPQGIALDTCGNLYITDVGNYRIRKITFDTTCGHTDTTTAIHNINTTTISIYPNPAYNELTVSGSNIHSLQLLNTVGQTIYSNSTLHTTKTTISISNLPKGIYFIKVNDSYVQRVLKE